MAQGRTDFSLLPCTSCHASDRDVTLSRCNTGFFQAVCLECGTRGPASPLKGEAVDKWNLMPRTIAGMHVD